MSQGGRPWYAESKKSIHLVDSDMLIIISAGADSFSIIRREDPSKNRFRYGAGWCPAYHRGKNERNS
jgi:hypothetical protein